jgi:WD40 repeat protein
VIPLAEIFKGEGHQGPISVLASAGDIVFSGTSDGVIKRSFRAADSHVYEFRNLVKVGATPVSISASGDGRGLYVLQNNNKIAHIEGESFTVTKEVEIKDYDATSMSYSAVTNELWVGDKKGILHILDGNDLTQKSIIEKKHNHGISIIKVSQDGKLIASGDSYRYIYVFDSETKQEVGCYPYHQAKIIGLDFSKDSSKLLTTGLDLTVGIADLATKSYKVIHRPNEKDLTASVFDGEGRFYTTGYDCSIRLWSK